MLLFQLIPNLKEVDLDYDYNYNCDWYRVVTWNRQKLYPPTYLKVKYREFNAIIYVLRHSFFRITFAWTIYPIPFHSLHPVRCHTHKYTCRPYIDNGLSEGWTFPIPTHPTKPAKWPFQNESQNHANGIHCVGSIYCKGYRRILMADSKMVRVYHYISTPFGIYYCSII